MEIFLLAFFLLPIKKPAVTFVKKEGRSSPSFWLLQEDEYDSFFRENLNTPFS
jgi:hypothetical protein